MVAERCAGVRDARREWSGFLVVKTGITFPGRLDFQTQSFDLKLPRVSYLSIREWNIRRHDSLKAFRNKLRKKDCVITKNKTAPIKIIHHFAGSGGSIGDGNIPGITS
jgi:hypothetical protein